jgi:adenosine deaminase
MQRGLTLEALGAALVEGAVCKKGLPETKIIIDVTRNEFEPAQEIGEWLFNAPRDIFVGLGISGGPDALPRARFSELCVEARALRIGVVAHAGELEGPESVRDAMLNLLPDRIVHAATMMEDEDVVKAVAATNVHVELCPAANLRLGVGDQSGGHIRQILDLGFSASINTDDQFIFNTSMSKEISYLLTTGLFEPVDVTRCILSARNAAFGSSAAGN